MPRRPRRLAAALSAPPFPPAAAGALRARGVAIAVLLGAAVLSVPAAAQQDFSEVEIETQLVGEGVWMLNGAGGNIAVAAGADGVFLVDDQYAPLTDKIRAAVAKINDRPLRFVLNTHWHGDHTGGNENLGEAGAVIVAHDNVRTRLGSDQFLEYFERHVPASPEAALPIVTFPDRITLHLNGDEIDAFHVPHAHTDGDAIVHFRKANVVHMGDTFFIGRYPYVDLGSGGDVRGVIAAADRVLELADADTRIIPGHGPLGGRDELRAYRDTIAAVVAAIEPRVAAGETLEQVQAAKPSAAYDEAWGQGFIDGPTFVEFVYRSLTERPGD